MSRPFLKGHCASRSQQGVQWFGPEYLDRRTSPAELQRKKDRSTALMVLLLSLACTALFAYDMFLLASGV